MSLLVAAFPEIAEEDFNRIQSYRKENDSLFHVVKPHFTIVFPANNITAEAFIDEIRKLAEGQTVIDFEITNTLVHKDDFRDHYHEFLVLGKGNEEIIQLHDRLYAGLLLPYLRADIKYIPHISIGNSTDRDICEQRISSFNTTPIRGRISELTIADYSNNVVLELMKIRLCV